MSDQRLPDNDIDIQLARRFRAVLDGEASSTSVGDPLLDTLLEFKRSKEQASPALSDHERASLWHKIKSETKHVNIETNTNTDTGPGSARVHPFWNAKNRAIWAAAACLLLVATAGIFYFTVYQQSELLASSQQKIETVTLADGSNVTLRPHSALYARSISEQEIILELSGEAYFEVTKNPDRLFSVEAGNGKVSVLGTRFDLSTWGKETQVYLEEGSVRFENLATDEAVTLSPGQSARIQSDNGVTTPQATDGDEFTDWMDHELIFTNQTARYIFDEFEHHFSIKITAPDSVLSISLSGGLSLDQLPESLRDLGLVLNGRFERTEGRTYKFVPNP